MSADETLREELDRLRATVARRMREQLEDGTKPPSPALLEAARKFLSDQGVVLAPSAARRAAPVVADLPYPAPDPE